MKKNDIAEICINSISNDGNGVGRLDGCAVFVPFTAIGDKLMVRLEKVRDRYAFGRSVQLLSESKDRILADCPLFTKCGGCDFRHITYEAELAAKQNMLADALKRIGGFDIELPSIMPSPVTEQYRNKVQFPIAQDERGLYPGFYAARSHRVVESASCCKLQSDEINCIAAESCEILTELDVTAYDEATNKGTLRHILIRQSSKNGDIMLCLVVNAKKLSCAKQFAAEITARFAKIKTVVLNFNQSVGNAILSASCETVLGSGIIEDEICGVPVQLSALSFMQINNASATRLYNLVGEFAAVKSGETLVDLYCGAGTIGLAISDDSVSLYGIETIEDAVNSAKRNAEILGRNDAHFLCDDAGAIKKLIDDGICPDIIVTDPPRKGCSQDVLDAIVESTANRAVMVSCNASTLARDLRYLCENGFKLTKAQAVDLFPRTKHVEAVALLIRDTE